MLRGVARLSMATMTTTLALQLAINSTISTASAAAAAKASSSISSVAAKAAYLQTHETPRHQSVPTLDSAPVRSAVVTRARHAPSVSGQLAASSTAIGGTWTSVGPRPIANLDSYGNVSGRITSLAVDPTNAAVVYAGSAGGGVWKTSDGGVTWSPLTDTQATLAIGAVAVDPQAHLTVYAATGENDRCGDCGLSQGVLKSTDGGVTWILYGQATFATADTQASVIVANGSRVMVGTSTGLYVSNDGGQSWAVNSSLASLSSISSPRVDVIATDYVHPGRYWAAVGERCRANGFIAVSNDSGSTWSINYKMPTAVSRIGLAVASNGWLYGSESACSDAQGNGYGHLVAIVKSTDGGVSWNVISPGPALPNYFSNGGTQSQGFYDNVVAVDASDGNTVVFGGVTMLATKDGGATFTDIARPYAGGPVHSDFHAIAFTAHSAFYTGNDGGVWKTTDLGGTGQAADWTNLNAGLGVTTFFSGTALDATHMIGGAQDDATSGLVPGGYAPPAWKPLLNFDGTWTAMDPTPGSNVIYGEHPWGFIYKGLSTETIIDPRQPGTGWVPAGPCWQRTDPACNEPSGFVSPFLMDPANPQHLLAATNRVYETASGGTPAGTGGWARTDQDLTTGTTIFVNGDWISSMSYNAGFLATASYGGAVYVKNGRPVPGLTGWVNATGNLPQATAATLGNDAWVTDIWLGATSASGVGNFSDMWVTMSGNGIGHVWHSTAGPFGQGPWLDMSGSGSSGIGNLVVDSITVTPSAVFIGTDAGTMVCTTCLNIPQGPSPQPPPTAAWYPLGAGLPNAKVDAVRVSQDNKFLTAWTHGRGAWTLPLEPSVAFDSTSMAFGDQSVAQTSAAQTVTLTNSGTALLNMASITVTGANAGDFQIVRQSCGSPPGPVASGASCQVSVLFTPQAGGPRSASLSFADNAPGNPHVVSLTGIGITPTVSLSPSSGLAFGDIAVGTNSSATLTVSNSGPVNLVFKGVTTTGPNANAFGVNNWSTCPISGGSVQPGTSCTFVVMFIVQSSGQQSATLNIADTAPDSPQLISLTGQGVVPSLSISPNNATLSFPLTNYGDTSAEQTVTLTNNGPGNLHAFSVYPTGNNWSDFVVSSNTCQNQLVAPAGSCTIGIQFRPTDLGPRSATLSISDNATGSPHLISLSGTAQGAKVNSVAGVSFGEMPLGAVLTKPITLKNTGNAPMTGLTATVFGFGVNPEDFSASGCAAPVAVGDSCTITVGFTPHASGHRIAYLEIRAPNTIGVPQFVTLDGIGLELRSVAAAPTNPSRSDQAIPPQLPPGPHSGPRPLNVPSGTSPRGALQLLTSPERGGLDQGAEITQPVRLLRLRLL